MPVRIRKRGGSEESCGDEEMVSGGMDDPLGTGETNLAEISPRVVADLLPKDPTPKQEGDGAAGSPAVDRLKSKTAEIISALHEAKQELAAELEANLKQLKSVLGETQRIAKEMEAVLREAKAEPEPEQKAKGNGNGGRNHEKQAGAWDPPTLKKNGSGGNEDEAWEPPKEAVKVYEDP